MFIFSFSGVSVTFHHHLIINTKVYKIPGFKGMFYYLKIIAFADYSPIISIIWAPLYDLIIAQIDFDQKVIVLMQFQKISFTVLLIKPIFQFAKHFQFRQLDSKVWFSNDIPETVHRLVSLSRLGPNFHNNLFLYYFAIGIKCLIALVEHRLLL